MFEILNSILFFIVAIGVLITFHEYGHFWVARRMGVIVLRFSIGFGPVIYRYEPKNSLTEFVVSAIPLGGYVRMLDETQDKVPERLLPFAFNRQPLYRRSAIVAAGPLANFLLAGLLYAATFMIGTEGLRPVVGSLVENGLAAKSGFRVGDELKSIDEKSIQSWSEHQFYLLDRIVSREPVQYQVLNDGQMRDARIDFADLGDVDLQSGSIDSVMGMFPATPAVLPIVDHVVAGYPAEAAGLRQGDEIRRVNEAQVTSWNDLVELISQSDAAVLNVHFSRDGVDYEAAIEPLVIERNGGQVKQIGIAVDVEKQLREANVMVTLRYGIFESLWKGFESMWATTVLTIKLLVSMITMQQSADSIGGPIAIAEHAGSAAQAGINNYLIFLALLSVSLGILNLLPIPVLDGGHLMFHLYEAISGSPPTEKMLIIANQIGVFLLVCLMGFAFYNDLTRIF